jgi:CDP-6-deoxy-D-xylo-4-hexulose-3-dehydrase
LDEFTEKRHENFNYLYTRLEEFAEGRFALPKKYPSSDPSWFGFPILLNPDKYDRRKVTEELTLRGVQNRLLFAGNIIKQPMFTKSKYPYRVVGDLAMTDNIMNNLFWVGTWHGLSSEQMKYSADTIMEVLG